MKIYFLKEELLKLLCIKDNYLYPNFSKKYKAVEKPKKNGGIRIIKPPNFNLRKIQRIILDKVLCHRPHLDCVYGLSKGKSILHNAKFHQKNANAQLLILDIQDFFTNVSSKDVKRIFNKIGFNKENSSVLTKICTVDGSLPQGAPTSPYLASLACLELDKEIYTYCIRRNLAYTRYFDDISISGENISDKDTDRIEKIICKYGFNCNQEKREFYGSNTSKVINSVFINGPSLSVTDVYRKEISEVYKKMLTDNTITNKRIFAGKSGFYLRINKKEAREFLKNLKEKHEI